MLRARLGCVTQPRCTYNLYSVVSHEFQSDGRRVKSTGDEAAALQASQQTSRRDGADEASAFFSRPVKVRSNGTRPLLPDRPGWDSRTNRTSHTSLTKLQLSISTFTVTVKQRKFRRAAKAGREEVQGAEEVQEDENTATELPVDQVSDLHSEHELSVCQSCYRLSQCRMNSALQRAAETVDEELNDTEEAPPSGLQVRTAHMESALSVTKYICQSC